MYKFMLFAVGMTPFWGFGQLKIDPKNEIFGGESKILTKGSIDWSIGESFLIKTLVSKNGAIFTTGFLQGVPDPKVQYSIVDNFENSFQFGPNPFTQDLWIGANEANLSITKLEVLNSVGQIVHKTTGPFSGIHFDKKLQLGSVNTGNYYLLIYYVVGDLYVKFKIIPISKI